MRIIKLPYNSFLAEFINIMMFGIGFWSVCFIIPSIQNRFYLGALIGMLILFPVVCYFYIYHFYLIRKRIILVPKGIEVSKKVITVKDKYFILGIVKKEIKIEWEDVVKVIFVEPLMFQFKLEKGNSFSIDSEYLNWLELINAIPTGKLEKKSFGEFLERFKANLATCKICGKVSFDDSYCYNCKVEKYRLYDLNYSSEKSYLKKNQLRYFAHQEHTEWKGQNIKFEKDTNWIPLGTDDK